MSINTNSPARSQITTSILPPHRKNRPKSLSKNEDATPSPSRFSPRPRIPRTLVECGVLEVGDRGAVYFARPVANRDLYPTPPPPKNLTKIPFEKRRCHAIPRPFQPPPPCALVDYGVVEVGEQAVRSILPALLQIATSILPPPLKISTKIPFEKRCRHAIPRPFQPPPPHTLVDCGVLRDWHRSVRSNSPARSQIATSILPPPTEKLIKNPL